MWWWGSGFVRFGGWFVDPLWFVKKGDGDDDDGRCCLSWWGFVE